MLLLQVFIALTSISASYQAVQITAVKYDLGGTPPNLTGPLEKNFELTEAEQYKVGEIKGAESFVYHNGNIYTGLADGRIVDVSDCGTRTITRMSPPSCAGGIRCGRPKGLRMDRQGRLIVADSANGIFRVDVNTGEKTVVYSSQTPVNGRKCLFINDVVVARDGTILFTDSSAKWTHKESVYITLEGEATGRVLAYNDKFNKTIVVMDKLAFPSGLEFGPDEESLLIAETGLARIRRLSLKQGPTWLQQSVFAANLPGLPDNIRASGRGTYWVAMSQARHEDVTSLIDDYADQPRMREMMTMMFTAEQLAARRNRYGMVVEINENGEIIRSLQDPTGRRVAAVTEAMERDNYLYLGSSDNNFISRVPLTKTFHVERFLQKIKSTCRATKINLNKLRIVLRQLVAIAEFRRVVLNAKKREEEEKARAAAARSTTTSAPTTTGSTTTGGQAGSTSSVTSATTSVTSTGETTAGGSTPTQPTTSRTSTAAQTTTASGMEESGGIVEEVPTTTAATAATTSTTSGPTTSGGATVTTTGSGTTTGTTASAEAAGTGTTSASVTGSTTTGASG